MKKNLKKISDFNEKLIQKNQLYTITGKGLITDPNNDPESSSPVGDDNVANPNPNPNYTPITRSDKK
ncbi:hypothetical protein LXD69_11215 [Flavobacterium sediminilitoris]|uniref:Uncharacterized protein n=1 Tax=Flavobacterium sediminilitoris TaxID=2024526 RepID=A0ABY4HJV9_9FLAO|nr:MULTISPECIES: hypothetical protein [Flavobacterium]UOX32612.1 hypothetical protein LXD69_11215 [Flavobacterium sediminilitoris]